MVSYRTGPFCGVLPEVSVSGDEAVLTVEIRTAPMTTSASMEYDEAIELERAAEFEGAVIEAGQGG